MQRFIAVALALVVGTAAGADVKLGAKLVVHDLYSGGLGVSGTQWTIDTDGKWEEAAVDPAADPKVTRSGRVSEKAMADLVAALKRHNPGALKTAGKVSVNPHTVVVEYGRNKAEYRMPATGELGKPDATVRGRFAGVFEAVKAAIPPRSKE